MQTVPAQSTELLPPPVLTDKPNGASPSVPHAAVVAAANDAALQAQKRLDALESLGKDIRKLEKRLGKEETVVAEAESSLKSARESRNKTQREINELHEELTNLATGKQSERLPFAQAEAAKKTTGPIAAGKTPAATSEQELQDAFDAMKLFEIGLKGSMADKLEADGVRNGKELRIWIQDRFRKPIKGIGKGAFEKLNELMAEKMIAMKKDAEKNAALQVPGSNDKAEIIAQVAAAGDPDQSALVRVRVWEHADSKTWSWNWQIGYGQTKSFNFGINAASREAAARTALADLVNRQLGIDREKLSAGDRTHFNAIEAEVLAAKEKFAKFDDAEIKEEAVEFIAVTPNILEMQIGQRVGGQWATRYSMTVGKVSLRIEWAGNHPTRVHAIAAVIDVVRDDVKKVLATPNLPNKSRNEANAILKDIAAVEQKVTKDLAAPEVPADVKAFWADRSAKTAESDVVPLSKAMGKVKKGRAKKGK